MVVYIGIDLVTRVRKHDLQEGGRNDDCQPWTTAQHWLFGEVWWIWVLVGYLRPVQCDFDFSRIETFRQDPPFDWKAVDAHLVPISSDALRVDARGETRGGAHQKSGSKLRIPLIVTVSISHRNFSIFLFHLLVDRRFLSSYPSHQTDATSTNPAQD